MKNEKIHFIGIGGTGLSAIALVLLEMGIAVSGSDMKESASIRSLQAKGAHIEIGHRAENIAQATLIVRSSAIPDHNVEVIAAKEAGVPVLKRIDFLRQILKEFDVIGVAGTHGKTTTTSMMVWVLDQLGYAPGFIVGGVVENLGVNARAGKLEALKGQQKPLFVIEADEYDNMFHGLDPKVAIITNVEHDHPDCFPTEEIYRQAFFGFIDKIQSDGILIASNTDKNSQDMLDYAKQKGLNTKVFGIQQPELCIHATNLTSQAEQGYAFDAYLENELIGRIALSVPGKHNVLNALAVLAALDYLGIDPKGAIAPLQTFKGAGRRFDIKYNQEGILLVDDYGHHPTEIAVTLSAAKDRYPNKKIWAVWQPHMYSRTLELLHRFEEAFGNADQVIVTNVFAAREQVRPEFSVKEQIVDHLHHQNARAICELDQVASTLLQELGSNDVVIVFSAGDATQINQTLIQELR